jgi:hypothetical protein
MIEEGPEGQKDQALGQLDRTPSDPMLSADSTVLDFADLNT